MKYLKKFEVLTASGIRYNNLGHAPKDYRDDYRVHQAYKDGYFHDMSEKYLDEFVYGIFRLFNKNGVLYVNKKFYDKYLTTLEMTDDHIYFNIQDIKNEENGIYKYDTIFESDKIKICESLYEKYYKINKFGDKICDISYQKEFLTEHPERYKDLEFIGYAPYIKDMFDYLWSAVDMGLL